VQSGFPFPALRLTVKRDVELAALYRNREELLREYSELEMRISVKR
jgi:hypothetical protein